MAEYDHIVVQNKLGTVIGEGDLVDVAVRARVDTLEENVDELNSNVANIPIVNVYLADSGYYCVQVGSKRMWLKSSAVVRIDE